MPWASRLFLREWAQGSPEDFPRESTPKRVITKRILDEKSGLAQGQPKIEIADSLHFCQVATPDENPDQDPRGLRHF